MLVFLYIDRIIVLSELFKKQLLDIGYKGTVEILYNTSSIEIPSFVSKSTYNRRFVYLTNYIRSKGIVELVECFSTPDMQELKLDTFGDIYENDIYNYICDVKTRNVKICGPINHESIGNILTGYDALILPSWNEGQPVILLEALSIGLPVIVSDVGDVKNIVGEKYPFTFIPRDKKSMKEVIGEFDTYECKNIIAENLYKRYQEYYSNNLFAAKVISLFN
jgi:glycosyltransferase involved in cell wall biosynthesis